MEQPATGAASSQDVQWARTVLNIANNYPEVAWNRNKPWLLQFSDVQCISAGSGAAKGAGRDSAQKKELQKDAILPLEAEAKPSGDELETTRRRQGNCMMLNILIKQPKSAHAGFVRAHHR